MSVNPNDESPDPLEGRGIFHPMKPKTYHAPWGKSLIWLSIIATGICLAVAFGIPFHLRADMRWHTLWPILVLLGAAPFTIFSYTIYENRIDVKRLLWSTSIPRAGLQSAEGCQTG